MRIVATSDFHGFLPERIPMCDLLLIAGDICPVQNHSKRFQAEWLAGEFSAWVDRQPAEVVVWTAGNHDFAMQEMSREDANNLSGIFLNDEAIEVVTKNGATKVWASPMSPTFGNWAFMDNETKLAEHWEKIPEDVEIVMVHGPMRNYQDLSLFPGYGKPTNCGSTSLLNRFNYVKYPQLKLFVCGHIHEAYGAQSFESSVNDFLVANVSHVSQRYKPVNQPMVFDIS